MSRMNLSTSQGYVWLGRTFWKSVPHLSHRTHYENEKPENQVAGVWATQYSFIPMRNPAYANSSFEIIPADKRKSPIF